MVPVYLLLVGVRPFIKVKHSGDLFRINGPVAVRGSGWCQGTQDSDIGILVRTNRQVGQITDALHAANLPFVKLGNTKADDRAVPGLRVTTMHRAKGLEFHAVAIAFLSEDAFPPKPALASSVDAADKREIIEREKALLHVAATRAKKVLRISWSGKPSNILPQGSAEQ